MPSPQNYYFGKPIPVGDEGWGLDNVRIDVKPMPEPSTFFLLGTPGHAPGFV